MADLKYSKEELEDLSLKELATLAKGEGIDLNNNRSKVALIKQLLKIEADDEVDDDELDEDDELEDELEDEADDEESDDEVDDEDELDDELEEDEIDDEPAPAKAKKAAAAKKPAAKKKSNDEVTTLAAKQVATLLGTEAKTLRQFFRSDASTVQPVGSGGRYEFDEADVPQIKKEFEGWKAAHASRGAKRGAGTGGRKSKVPANVQEIEEIEEIEELEELDDEIDDEDLELDDED